MHAPRESCERNHTALAVCVCEPDLRVCGESELFSARSCLLCDLVRKVHYLVKWIKWCPRNRAHKRPKARKTSTGRNRARARNANGQIEWQWANA